MFGEEVVKWRIRAFEWLIGDEEKDWVEWGVVGVKEKEID